jgi:hypothetical protein
VRHAAPRIMENMIGWLGKITLPLAQCHMPIFVAEIEWRDISSEGLCRQARSRMDCTGNRNGEGAIAPSVRLRHLDRVRPIAENALQLSATGIAGSRYHPLAAVQTAGDTVHRLLLSFRPQRASGTEVPSGVAYLTASPRNFTNAGGDRSRNKNLRDDGRSRVPAGERGPSQVSRIWRTKALTNRCWPLRESSTCQVMLQRTVVVQLQRSTASSNSRAR